MLMTSPSLFLYVGGRVSHLTPRAHRLSCGYENDAVVTQQVIILGYTLSILIYLVIYTVAKT